MKTLHTLVNAMCKEMHRILTWKIGTIGSTNLVQLVKLQPITYLGCNALWCIALQCGRWKCGCIHLHPLSLQSRVLAPPAKSRLAAPDYNQNSIPFPLHNDYHGLIHCTMDQTIWILSPLQFHIQFMFGYELKTDFLQQLNCQRISCNSNRQRKECEMHWGLECMYH